MAASSFDRLLHGCVSSCIQDYIYLDDRSLTRLQGTSKTVRENCKLKPASSKILHLNLTTPTVQPLSEEDLPLARILEVSISHGLSFRSSELRCALQQCRSLHHIHLQILPDPCWLVAKHGADMSEEKLWDIVRDQKIAPDDGDGVLLAKFAEHCNSNEGWEHVDACLNEILQAFQDDAWCPDLCGVSAFCVLDMLNLRDHHGFYGYGRGEKRTLISHFDQSIIFMNEDGASSEKEWRRLPCSSSFLFVGRPSRDTGRRPEDARLYSHAACFANYYTADDDNRSMHADMSVQVPGVFPNFCKLLGKECRDLAPRFIQPNLEFGQDVHHEAGRIFYESCCKSDACTACIDRIRDIATDLAEDPEEESEWEDDFSDFDEEAYAQYDLLGRACSRGSGSGIGLPRFYLPEYSGDDADAECVVKGTPLSNLRPQQPGVAARTWQELAGVATCQPDIKWLGRVVKGGWSEPPSARRWIDFRIIHAGEHTDLRDEGHRLRFGEKCLKYGSIDICVQALSVWPQGEEVGYSGVYDLFTELRCVKSFEHYWPKVCFFLEEDNFAKWVQPHVKTRSRSPDREGNTISRQQVANSVLAKVSQWDVRSSGVPEVVRKCREDIRAEPTIRDHSIDFRVAGNLTAWEHLFGRFACRGREGLQAFDLMLRHGHPISSEARGGESEAETLRSEWEFARGFGDWDVFVDRCEKMTAFTPEGIAVLRSWLRSEPSLLLLPA